MSNPAFGPAFGLTDAEISELSRDKLIWQYQNLRSHHQAAVRAHDKRDRSAILRMAGNIASGICSIPNLTFTQDNSAPASIGDPAGKARLARISVEIARAILAEVDR
jgi:hypothetical protein